MSVELKEVLLFVVIPIPRPRALGAEVRNLIKLIKVWVIWLCPILYPDPNPEYSGEELVRVMRFYERAKERRRESEKCEVNAEWISISECIRGNRRFSGAKSLRRTWH